MSDADDLQLRQSFQMGDRQAFATLAAPHLDTLYTFCLRLLGNPSDAEEIAQESLVRALGNASRYDPARPFRPWLFTIAANLGRDRTRGAWWRMLVPWRADPPGPDPLAALEASDEDARVRRALATLPEMYREAVSLFHLEGMTYEEMSLITGASTAALKQRVRRGNQLLRGALGERYPHAGLVRTAGDGERG